MINLDDTQGSTGLLPRLPGLGPSWPNLGQDEPLNVQQQYMAQRRALESDRISKLYLDEKEFARLANQSDIREGRRLSLLGDDLPKVALNAAYLSHRMGRKVTASEYELARDNFAAANFGQEAVTDGQFFDLVKSEYDVRRQKVEAMAELRLQMAGQSLEDAVTGKRTPTAETWTAWRDKHYDLVGGAEDLPSLAAAVADRNEFQQTVDKYAHLAGPGLDLLKRFTKGDTNPDDLSDFAKTLVTVPREDQDKVIDLIALGADVGQIDRGALKEFARAMGQTFSRGFNFIPQRVMQDRQLGVTNFLEALEAGVEVYIPMGGDTGQAVVGNAPEGAAAAALEEGSWRQATAEERQQMTDGAQQSLAVFRLERELRAVADGNVDPIKRFFKGGFMGALEGGAIGVAGSLPLLTATAVNPFAGMMAYQSMEFDRIMTENPDMSVRAAMGISTLEGAWQAGLDMVQLRTLKGALPITGRLLGRVKSTGLRRALGFAASGAEQFGQELAQDIGTLAIDSLSSALREDMKDKSFTLELGEYWKQTPEVLVSSLIFGLWGGGAITSKELRGTPAEWDEAARIVGISEDGRRRMKAATTPEELDAVVNRELKGVTTEARAAGALYAKAKMQAAAAVQADPNEPTLEITKDAEGNPTYTLRTPDDQVLIETSDPQAAQAAFLDYRTAAQGNEVQALREVIDYWQKRDPNLSIEQAPPVLVQEELSRLEGIGDTAGIEKLRQRLVAADIDPDGDLTGVQIFGSASIEDVGEGVYRGTILVREGATPETVLEEVNHVFVRKALAKGDVTIDQLSAWLDQTATSTGLDIKRGNETEIIESIAQVGMDLFNGRLDQAQLPQSLVDYLRRLMRVIKEVYARAIKVTEAFDKGEIDANFESFLMESMGLSPQSQIDLNSTSTAASVATGEDLSVGRGTAPAADLSLGITVAPLRVDNLTELSKKEVRKRAKSAKFIHLQQVVNDVTAAYGVNVLSRQPVVGTWTEGGRVSLEVPESFQVDTDDLDLGEEMAALIAISAPELQNGAMVWRDDPDGPDVIISFKAKSAEAALEVAQQFNAAGIKGSSYDVETRTFSVAMVGATDENIKELTDYVEHHTGQGRIAPGKKGSKSYRGRSGTGKFPGEAEYRGYLQKARDRAERTGNKALGDVVSRAERRLERQVAAAKIAGKARRTLRKMAQPLTAASSIEAQLAGRTFDNIRQLGLFLDDRFRTIHGHSGFDPGAKNKPGSPEGIALASDALVYDILDGLSTDGSGMGWYDERVHETIRELVKVHPEFDDDPLALSVYIGILASTSQGYTVVENFKQADRVYDVYKATGRMPTDLEFAKADGPINSNIAQIQALIDEYGVEGYAEFMDTEITGQALRDQYGMQPSGVNLGEVVRGNRVLGPKIGSFFNNLRGRFNTITMDLWYTRTMHRYLGETVVPLDSEKMQNAIAKFRGELTKADARIYGLDIESALKDDESMVQSALTLFQRWARGKTQYAEKGYTKFEDGSLIEKAARTIFAIGGMKGAPQNKSHRTYFADVVMAAKEKLAKLGFKLTEADMQAVVWYREKNLFARTGVANAAAKPADYLDAVMVSRSKSDAAKEKKDLADLEESNAADYSIGQAKVAFADQLQELQAGEPDPVDTSKTFWLVASSSGDIVDILGNEQDATNYFQTMASAGEWLWEYQDGLATRSPVLKRGVAERRADGYIDTVRRGQEKAEGDTQGRVFYGADTSPETATSAGEIPGFTPDGQPWAGQEESVVYHGGRNLDPQGTDPGGYGATQTLKPRRPDQTYLFSVGRRRVSKALESALNSKPGERLAMYERAKEMFDRVAVRRGDETGSSGYARTLQSLWELDAILKVLPPEVRGKVGGFTKIAELEPTDLYKGDELVAESNSPLGARISAWMKEGMNIGEAGQQTVLPEGYSARRATDPARATKATDDFLVRRLATVGKQLDRYLANEYRIAIERAVKAARPKKGDNGVRKSTLGPEAQTFADKVTAAVLLDNDATAARMAAIEAALIAPETTDEQRIDLVEEWGVVNTFGDFENRNAETLAQAYDELRTRLKAGRDSWRILEEARIATQRQTVASIISSLGEPGKAARFKDKGAVTKLGELLTAAGLDHASFEQFIRAVIPDEAVAARWSDALRQADTGAQDMELAEQARLIDAVKAAAKTAGLTKGAALRQLKTEASRKVRAIDGRKVVNERISIELAKKIVRGTADRGALSDGDLDTLREALADVPADSRKEFVTIQRVASAGTPVEISLTPAQAIQIELSWDQPDVQDKMRREGWTDESLEDIRAINSDPIAAGVLSFLRDFYAGNYSTVNPVYSRMFGMNMPQAKFYAPSRFLSSTAVKDIGLDGSPQTSGSTPGFAKARVAHSAPLAPEDSLTVFQQHVAQTAHWVNFAELAREARGVANNLQVQEALRQAHGEGVVNSLGKWVELLEQRGGNKSREITWISKAFGSIVGGTAISSLGFNLKTVFIQLDSAMRFMLALDPRQIGGALLHPVELAKAMPKAWFSPTVQRRLKGGMNPAAQFLFARGSTKPGALSSLAWLSMQPIQQFDAAATTLSSAMVYRAALADAKAAGLPDDQAEVAALDAMDAAVYRYSQPTGFGSKSLVENTGNAITKAWTLFLSDPRLKTGVMVDAVREISKGKNVGMNVQRIVALEVMALASHVVASAYRDAFSDDEDEDIWSPAGFIQAMALAPLQGFFLAGTVSDLALRKILGEPAFARNRDPFINTAESAFRAAAGWENLLWPETAADGLKAWNNALRGIAVSTPLGSPAALLNIVKPFIGLQENIESDD
jgi:hypothetical protein